jgi:hypothetical protein
MREVLRECLKPEHKSFDSKLVINNPFRIWCSTTYTGEKSREVKQYRQCTYNVTLRRVHETTVAVEKR